MEEATENAQPTIKPEYSRVLDNIRNIYTQCGAKLTENAPSLWPINTDEKAKAGNLVIELDEGAPITLWTPEGSYHVTGSFTRGDNEEFRRRLEEAYQVEVVEESLGSLERTMPVNYGKGYKPVFVKIEPKK